MLTFWKAHLNTCQTLDCIIRSHVLDHCEYYQKDITNRVQIPLYEPQKKITVLNSEGLLPCTNAKLSENLNGTWYW